MIEFNKKFSKIDKVKFVSNKHSAQTRLFGFITTNIRNFSSISQYVNEIIPDYIKRKEDIPSWEKWCYEKDILKKNKQKFKRLEIAKILFRKLGGNKYLNNTGEQLYHISKKYGENYLNLILSFYLLLGTYFGVKNQGMVEIEKILASFHGDFIKEATECLIGNKKNRLLLGMIFYNPSSSALDLSYKLFSENFTNEQIKHFFENKDIVKKIKNASSIGNFKKDILVCLNYKLLKEASKKVSNEMNLNKIFEVYINLLFSSKINLLFNINDKNELLAVLKKSKNLLKDIVLFSLNIKEKESNFIKKNTRKGSLKSKVKEKFENKCFFDYCDCDSEAHQTMYFKDKKGNRYLEAHHMIQMENSRHFKNDIDILENLIPLCPNCHRKIHSGENKEVKELITTFFKNSKKEELIREGIFVDINTLASFYGIEDIEK